MYLLVVAEVVRINIRLKVSRCAIEKGMNNNLSKNDAADVTKQCVTLEIRMCVVSLAQLQLWSRYAIANICVCH